MSLKGHYNDDDDDAFVDTLAKQVATKDRLLKIVLIPIDINA